jgi:hypothetical protein
MWLTMVACSSPPPPPPPTVPCTESGPPGARYEVVEVEVGPGNDPPACAWSCPEGTHVVPRDGCVDAGLWRAVLPPARCVALDDNTLLTADADQVVFWELGGPQPTEVGRITTPDLLGLVDAPLMRRATTERLTDKMPQLDAVGLRDRVDAELAKLGAGEVLANLGWACDLEGDPAVVATNWSSLGSAVFQRVEGRWRAEAVLPTGGWLMGHRIHVAAGQVLVPHEDRIDVFVRGPDGWVSAEPIPGATDAWRRPGVAWTGAELLVMADDIRVLEPRANGWRRAGRVRADVRLRPPIAADRQDLVVGTEDTCRFVHFHREPAGWKQVASHAVPDCDGDSAYGNGALVAVSNGRALLRTPDYGALFGPIAGPWVDLSFHRWSPGTTQGLSRPSVPELGNPAALGPGLLVVVDVYGTWFRADPPAGGVAHE